MIHDHEHDQGHGHEHSPDQGHGHTHEQGHNDHYHHDHGHDQHHAHGHQHGHGHDHHHGPHHHDLHSHPHIHSHTPSRLDNPVRAAELNPEATLVRLGFQAGQVLCDIGAGSGIFTIPAARLATADPTTKVLALDIKPEMLDAIRHKAQDAGLQNIDLRQVIDHGLPVEDRTVDLALLVTVLHEIIDYPVFLSEIQRMLKPGGRLAVIEFHDRETPFGPPVPERLGQSAVTERVTAAGFAATESFELGPNFYALIFIKK